MVGNIEPLSNLNAVTPDGFSGTFPANPKAFAEALARQGQGGRAPLRHALYNPGAQPGEWLTPVAEKASPGAQKPIPAQEGAKPEANRGESPGPAPLGVCTPAHPGGEREFYTAYRRALGEQWSAHRSGESPLPPAQSLALRAEMERVDRVLDPSGQSLWGDSSPSEKAHLARQREEQLRKQNDLALAACGPVFCAGGTVARALGAPEQAVSDAAIVSFNLAGAAAAVPAFRQELGAPAPRNLMEPAAAAPAAARASRPAYTIRQGSSAARARAEAAAAQESAPQSLRPRGAGRYGELGAASLPKDAAPRLSEIIGEPELGPLIGRGGSKDVYAYKGGEAVGVMRDTNLSISVANAGKEIGGLRQLQELGIPTVRARGPVGIASEAGEVRAGVVYERLEQGSKDVVRLKGRKIRTVGDSKLLNEKSLADLEKIRDTMIEKKVKIDDLQFLIGKDGRIVVSDPLTVYIGIPPSPRNLEMIQQLIGAAKKNIKGSRQ